MLHSVRLSLVLTLLPNLVFLWLVGEATERWMTPAREWQLVGRLVVGAAYGLALFWLLALFAQVFSPETALEGVRGSVLLDFHLAAALAGMTTLVTLLLLDGKVTGRSL